MKSRSKHARWLSLSLLNVLVAAACGPVPNPALDASNADSAVDPDASAGDAMPDVDAGPPRPGSSEALAEEACRARPASSAPLRLSYATGEPAGRLRDTAPGDVEGVHLIPTEPMRVTRLRVNLRGGAGGRGRVHLTEDYARSQPAYDVATWPLEFRDLTPPVEVNFRENGWVEIPLERPVILHPAHHAWIVFEHVEEPLGLAIGMGTGPARVSMVRSEAIIANIRAGGDPYFEWVGIGDTEDYLAEAQGTSLCGPLESPWFRNTSMTSRLEPMVGAASSVDVDGDGLPDAVGTRAVAMMPDRPVVQRNRGDGTFETATDALGLAGAVGTLSIFADYDGDGDLDVFLADNQSGLGPFDTVNRGSSVWLRGDDGRYTRVDQMLEPPGPSAAAATADCDGDGVLDLAVGQWLRQYPQNPAPDFLFKGLGNGRFEDISAAAGLPPGGNRRPTYGVQWADYDDDGDQDLFVANYGGNPNELWRNDGRCHLTNVATRGGLASDDDGVAGTSFGFELGDYDNDGDLDAFETNIGHPRYDGQGTDHSRLLRNGGAPSFSWTRVAENAGIAHVEGDIEGAFGDYDNDGDLDLYVASTYPFQYSRLYRQESDHTFVDVTYLAGVAAETNGRATWADVDRDGDLDLFVAPAGRTVLFRNELARPGSGAHWLELELRAPGPNTRAVGATITVEAGPLRMRRDVFAGRSTYGTQSPYEQHFGLAGATTATVRVRWPDGMRTEYAGVAADGAYVITRGMAPMLRRR